MARGVSTSFVKLSCNAGFSRASAYAKISHQQCFSDTDGGREQGGVSSVASVAAVVVCWRGRMSESMLSKLVRFLRKFKGDRFKNDGIDVDTEEEAAFSGVFFTFFGRGTWYGDSFSQQA